MRRASAALLAVVLALSVGCSTGLQPHVSAAAAASLTPDVAAVRAAVAANDAAGADRALVTLKQHIEQLRATKAITDLAAARVVKAADAVHLLLVALPAPTTTAPPDTAPPDTASPKGDGKGQGNGD